MKQKSIIAIAALFLIFALSHAHAVEETGISYAEVPFISIDTSRSYTIIEAEVENTGYDTVFICLPSDWEVDEEVLNAYGENVLTNRWDIIQKYGKKRDRFSFIANNFVFDFNYRVARGSPIEVSGCKGWYVRPNERLRFRVKLRPGPSSAVFDPLYIENNYNYSWVRVKKWYQEFRIYTTEDYGFVEAPYIVKGAKLIEAYPGIFSNKSYTENKTFYVEKFMEEENITKKEEAKIDLASIPSWDSWFADSALFDLKNGIFANTNLEFYEIPEQNITVKEKATTPEEEFIPVWLFDARESNFISYAYEWRRDRGVEGGIDIELYPTIKEEKAVAEKIDLTTVPEWFAWF